jgi:rod shape-determining protein MreC
MLSPITRVLRGNRELSTFLVCAGLSFLCLFLPQGIKNAVSAVLSGTLLGPAKSAVLGFSEMSHVRAENAELRGLAVELARERADLVEYRYENDRLRELLSVLVTFPAEKHEEMLPARVVGMPGGRVIESIHIDKGRDDGVLPGMAVVVPEGLVGKVSRVFPTRSHVEPLASASSGVSVVTERGRIRGIVKPRYGAASRRVTWAIEYVQARSDIISGDLVVTSGLGGVYSAGITVGRVVSVEEQPLTMSIEVELAVDFSTVEQVFVMTRRASTEEANEIRERLLLEIEREAGLVGVEATPEAGSGTPETGSGTQRPDGAPADEQEEGER